MQVWSCFEDLVIRKIMMYFKFNLDAQFNSYNFFNSNFACMWWCHNFCLLSDGQSRPRSLPRGVVMRHFRWWFPKPSPEAHNFTVVCFGPAHFLLTVALMVLAVCKHAQEDEIIDVIHMHIYHELKKTITIKPSI